MSHLTLATTLLSLIRHVALSFIALAACSAPEPVPARPVCPPAPPPGPCARAHVDEVHTPHARADEPAERPDDPLATRDALAYLPQPGEPPMGGARDVVAELAYEAVYEHADEWSECVPPQRPFDPIEVARAVELVVFDADLTFAIVRAPCSRDLPPAEPRSLFEIADGQARVAAIAPWPRWARRRAGTARAQELDARALSSPRLRLEDGRVHLEVSAHASGGAWWYDIDLVYRGGRFEVVSVAP